MEFKVEFSHNRLAMDSVHVDEIELILSTEEDVKLVWKGEETSIIDYKTILISRDSCFSLELSRNPLDDYAQIVKEIHIKASTIDGKPVAGIHNGMLVISTENTAVAYRFEYDKKAKMEAYVYVKGGKPSDVRELLKI